MSWLCYQHINSLKANILVSFILLLHMLSTVQCLTNRRFCWSSTQIPLDPLDHFCVSILQLLHTLSLPTCTCNFFQRTKLELLESLHLDMGRAGIVWEFTSLAQWPVAKWLMHQYESSAPLPWKLHSTHRIRLRQGPHLKSNPCLASSPSVSCFSYSLKGFLLGALP